MNDIGLKTYEHIKELLYNKVNKEITISSEAINYVIDYVDDLQTKLDSCIKSNKERQQRIDKAIEYIDRMTRVIDYDDDELITWEHIIDIENILRGDEDDIN